MSVRCNYAFSTGNVSVAKRRGLMRIDGPILKDIRDEIAKLPSCGCWSHGQQNHRVDEIQKTRVISRIAAIYSIFRGADTTIHAQANLGKEITSFQSYSKTKTFEKSAQM